MRVLLGVVAFFAGILALLNGVQAILGRQLVRPSRSRRSRAQLQRESLAATVAMGASALAAVGLLLHVSLGWISMAGGLAVVSMASIFILRRVLSPGS